MIDLFPLAISQTMPATLTLSNTQQVEYGQRSYTCRTVSWNASYLAAGASDRLIHVLAAEANREVLAVSGHTAPVTAVRWRDSNLILSSAAADVRLWDVRGGTQQRIVGQIKAAGAVRSLEWETNHSPDGDAANDAAVTNSMDHFAVTVGGVDKHAGVSIYDRRKLTSPVHQQKNVKDTEVCQLFREYAIAGTGKGEVCIWSWKKSATSNNEPEVTIFPAHSRAIYSLSVSPTRLVTGGADSACILWDMHTMTAEYSLETGTKYIASTALKGRYLAVATSWADDLQIVDSISGRQIGKVPWTRGGGAEEVCWHPRQPWLACARSGGNPAAPVVVVKLTIE